MIYIGLGANYVREKKKKTDLLFVAFIALSSLCAGASANIFVDLGLKVGALDFNTLSDTYIQPVIKILVAIIWYIRIYIRIPVYIVRELPNFVDFRHVAVDEYFRLFSNMFDRFPPFACMLYPLITLNYWRP